MANSLYQTFAIFSYPNNAIQKWVSGQNKTTPKKYNPSPIIINHSFHPCQNVTCHNNNNFHRDWPSNLNPHKNTKYFAYNHPKSFSQASFLFYKTYYFSYNNQVIKIQMKNHGTVGHAIKKLDKKNYNLIPYEVRKVLIDLVISQGLSVYRASKVMNIKNTTAKAILRRYRNQGVIFCRKHEREQQQPSLFNTPTTKIKNEPFEAKIQAQPPQLQTNNQASIVKQEYLSDACENLDLPFFQNYGPSYIYYFQYFK